MKRLTLRQSGDTIIEVLLSITILGLVLTSAYTLANRNLGSGISAGWRDQALASAQTQVERIINAQKTGDTALGKYTNFSGDFCILANGEPKAKDSSECKNYDDKQYSLAVHYAKKVFTVTAQWTPAVAASYQDQLTLYYKLAEAFSILTPPGCQPQTVDMPKTGTGELWWGGPTTYQIDLPRSLVASCGSGGSSSYDLKVTPFDESHCGVAPLPACVSPNIKRPEQINERVFIEGLNSDGSLIFRTPPTDDIPLNQTEITSTFRVSITRQVDFLRVKHCSVHPDATIYRPCRNSANSVHGTTITITSAP